jgi:hypothetical protein
MMPVRPRKPSARPVSLTTIITTTIIGAAITIIITIITITIGATGEVIVAPEII